jgi:hypothetical protein
VYALVALLTLLVSAGFASADNEADAARRWTTRGWST